MSEYTAPIADMQFVIERLCGLDALATIPAFAEVNAELVTAILNEAGTLANEVLAPLNRIGDTVGAVHTGDGVRTPDGWREAYGQFVDGGWNGLSFPTGAGGQGLPKLLATAVAEMWNGANLSFALGPMLTQGAAEALAHHGNDELRRLYLENLVVGRWMGTMNLTEPQAGSDLSAVRTRAVPHGDHYLVTGQKIFITYGEHDLTENIVHLVLARLPDAPAGTRGISLFVVPKFLVNPDGSLGRRNDVRCASIEHKLGIHGSPTAVLIYGEQGGAVGYLVGEPNRGLEYMFTMMNNARHAVGLEGVAIGEIAYQKALKFARERVQGRPVGYTGQASPAIIEHPDVKRMLLTMKSGAEAMRAVAYLCALAFDLGQSDPDPAQRAYHQRRGDLLTPIVKGWCTEYGQEMASLGVQVHGGMGFIEETGAAQYLRDARITTIYEGTTGIQAQDLVGRKTLRDGGKAARELLAEMRNDATTWQSDADARLSALGRTFATGVAALDETVAWMLASQQADPRLSAAGSVSYLKQWGIVAGAWLMIRAAALCLGDLAEGRGDPGFARAKIAGAEFFVAQMLPQAEALARIVAQGSSAVLVPADEAFG
ncbi:MAG: acyl-CoA dehydrogenase C-terminal domain-containing protein [Gammaproteobacteria bacterium]